MFGIFKAVFEDPSLGEIAKNVNMFFIFSFAGWVLECIVLTIEKRKPVIDRGFIHGPFCIIYGFGSMLGYILLKPFSFNYIVLFIVGAIIATLFEFFTAQLMTHIFGSFWWDYSKKFLNYKGMICLESTIGWGIVSVSLFAFLYDGVAYIACLLPEFFAIRIALVLCIYYIVDFAISMRAALLCNKSKAANQTCCDETVSDTKERI